MGMTSAALRREGRRETVLHILLGRTGDVTVATEAQGRSRRDSGVMFPLHDLPIVVAFDAILVGDLGLGSRRVGTSKEPGDAQTAAHFRGHRFHDAGATMALDAHGMVGGGAGDLPLLVGSVVTGAAEPRQALDLSTTYQREAAEEGQATHEEENRPKPPGHPTASTPALVHLRWW